MLNQDQAVATVVLEHSECAEVFQRHRIDFCCRGHESIAVAAQAKGVDVDALLSELSRAIATRNGASGPDPRELSTPRLIAHIVSTHHEYLRTALPFVRGLADKVGRVHGDHDPQLRELAVAVGELSNALLPHLDEEEELIFPALTAPSPDPDAVSALLATMMGDHHAVAALLERIHAASRAYSLPDWACNSYRTLFSELQRMEADIYTHVHLENHVLAPRFATVSPAKGG